MLRRAVRPARAAVVALAAAGLAAGVLAAAPAADARTVFRPGAAGLGDPYFPHEGNGGYRVRHYTLDLAYEPATHQLSRSEERRVRERV